MSDLIELTKVQKVTRGIEKHEKGAKLNKGTIPVSSTEVKGRWYLMILNGLKSHGVYCDVP